MQAVKLCQAANVWAFMHHVKLRPLNARAACARPGIETQGRAHSTGPPKVLMACSVIEDHLSTCHDEGCVASPDTTAANVKLSYTLELLRSCSRLPSCIETSSRL